jgi:hypothetical protein
MAKAMLSADCLVGCLDLKIGCLKTLFLLGSVVSHDRLLEALAINTSHDTRPMLEGFHRAPPECQIGDTSRHYSDNR